MANKIDSNSTGLAIAEEASLRTLPGSPVWYEVEPNSYTDFGSEITTVARSTINPSRQSKKGVVVDLDASGGFSMDATNETMQRLAQGFLFADAHEKPATQPMNGTAVAITKADGTNADYEAVSGLGVFVAGHLVKASGFGAAGNNGLKRVTTVASASLTVAETLTEEVAPPAAAKLEAVGFQGATGDLNLVVTSAAVTLTSAVLDFTTLALNVGEYVFVGGDATAAHFVNNASGFARIKSISAHALVFDDTSWAPVSETGTGLTIQIFFGTFIRNEKASSLIKRRSYQLERQLGNDGNGIQSEILVGSIPNELTVNMPLAEKITADLSFVALDNEQRSGTVGIKAGTRVPAPVEDIFNTTSNLVRAKMAIGGTLNPSSLFAYLQEVSITVNNNVTPNKALAVLGGFDASAGNFDVTGSVTAYFADVAAVAAVRNNADVGLNVIAANDNKGFVFDIPLVSLGGGKLNVEKDSPITIQLDANAAECEAGYTLATGYFNYIPDVGMPNV